MGTRQPQRRKTAAEERGFTLVEVIAILVLLGILSVVAVNRYVNTGVDAQAAADRLKNNLRYAQIRAMNASTPWGIDFASGSYTLTTNGAASATKFPGESANTITMTSGVTISSTVDPINFDQRGSPGATTATITITAGSKTATITVTKNTGFIP